MASYLNNQLSAFKSSVSSSSTKLANKRTVPAPTSRTATPPLLAQSTKPDLKRKRPEQTTTFSQPQDTGKGRNIMTQVTYAIEYLKSKSTPQSLADIVSYLSVQHEGQDFQKLLNTILVNHEKVEFVQANNDIKGAFRFRPVHNIRSKDTLLAHLQSRTSAQGLSARELREGWVDAEASITELEEEGKLLVTRNKKDNHAKMIWINDHTLTHTIDLEFHEIWEKIKLPEAKTLANELEKVGLTPANKSRNVKKAAAQDAKKTKKPRRGGKTTNTHMAGILRDYSHLKK